MLEHDKSAHSGERKAERKKEDEKKPTLVKLSALSKAAKENPLPSIKELARKMKLGDGTTRRGLKRLGIKSRARVKRFLLMEKCLTGALQENPL